MIKKTLYFLTAILVLIPEYTFAADSASEWKDISLQREIIEWSVISSAGIGALALRLVDEPWPESPVIGGETGKTYHSDTISDLALSGGAAVLGGFILLCPNNDGFMNRTTYENVKGYAAASSFNLLFTSLTKNIFGRKRPSYDNFPEDKKNTRGRKSFVSGHSSTAFCSATYTSLYIYNYIGDTGETFDMSMKIGSALLLHASAGFIAWTRVHDNVHHPSDVAAGAVAGSAFAALSFWYFNCSGSKIRVLPENLQVFVLPDEEGASVHVLRRF